MEKLRSLPFKVGQRVESRSFVQGYRGAWFRCEIKEIGRKRVALEYYDFSDEKISWMKSLYHKFPGKSKGAKKELMLRPQFPPVYRDGEASDVCTLSEVIVVINSVWKVGDLVDWFCDGAYWSGKITDIRGDDKVEIQLLPRPLGEGLIYEASCKDLRPSLDWSQKYGWKVPVPQGADNYSSCARLIHPINQGKLGTEGKKDVETAHEFPLEHNSSTSRSSAHSLPYLHGSGSRGEGSKNQTAVVLRAESQEANRDVEARESGVGKGSCSDSVSSSYVRASAELPAETSCKECASGKENESSKRIRLSERILLNSTSCDSVESVIVDLEELLSRVKWTRHILELSDTQKAGWKFLEYRASENQTGHTTTTTTTNSL